MHGKNTLMNDTNMERIEKLWFDEGRIHIMTSSNCEYSRPLEAFPLLLEATSEQRAKYEIGIDGDDVHWDDIDEDIHISSFFINAEPDTNNAVANLFKRFPWIGIADVANSIKINKSLMMKYIYGINKPTELRIKQITDAIDGLNCKVARP